MVMDKRLVTRRAALTALAALAAAPGMAWAGPAAVRFSEIRIDVSPLRRNGDGDFADWAAAVLPGALRQAFAPYLAPGDRSAPILVVRIDQLFLGPQHSGGFGGNPVLDAIDGVEGEGIVMSRGGQQLASYPLYSAVGADAYLNMPYQLDIARRRVETLARSFAQWLPGKMGL
jgi:hypothetical protein